MSKHLELDAFSTRPIILKQGKGVLEEDCAAGNRHGLGNIVLKKLQPFFRGKRGAQFIQGPLASTGDGRIENQLKFKDRRQSFQQNPSVFFLKAKSI